MDLRRRLPDGNDAIGGNLVASRGRMVIATPTQLLGFTMFGQIGEKVEADGQSQTVRPSSDTLEARGLAPMRSGR